MSKENKYDGSIPLVYEEYLRVTQDIPTEEEDISSYCKCAISNVKYLIKRIEFLEARNTELQANNTEMRGRAMAVERLVAVFREGQKELDPNVVVSSIMMACVDYMSVTSAEVHEEVWKKLLTYPPIDLLGRAYCCKVKSVSPTTPKSDHLVMTYEIYNIGDSAPMFTSETYHASLEEAEKFAHEFLVNKINIKQKKAYAQNRAFNYPSINRPEQKLDGKYYIVWQVEMQEKRYVYSLIDYGEHPLLMEHR